MKSLFASTIVERGRGNEKRLSATSWTKKSIPLKNSSLFNKAKHSDEWHQAINAGAGVLHPADPKFPYHPLRQATDIYLNKKGKLNQADTDIRLAILIESHDEAKDIAIAACAHAMSAMSVRALLSAELDVHQGNYWGLGTFLQSLVAANSCNPASVTDLEAQWARGLLPYAMHGSGAAAKLLEGVSRMLRAIPTPNMNVVPEFSALTRRALTDFATQLEGMRLKSNWVAAHAIVAWMVDLARTSPPVTPPGHLLPEHLLDAQFPIWRRWATWRPNVKRIMFLNVIDDRKKGLLPDLLELEGPDFVTGTMGTLKEGIIARYTAGKPIIRFKSLVIELPEATRQELAIMLERISWAFEFALQGGEGAFRLFIHLVIARPINKEALKVLEAVSKVRDVANSHVPEAVLHIYASQKDIGGSQIPALQHLLLAFDQPGAEDLTNLMLQPWLVQGIEKCIQECQGAIRTHIEEGIPWTHLAFEFHTFLSALRESKQCFPMLSSETQGLLEMMSSSQDMKTLFTIYDSIKAPNGSKKPPKENSDSNNDSQPLDLTKRVSAPAYLLGESEKERHPLKEAIEEYTRDRLMMGGTISHSSQRTIGILLQIWDQTETGDQERGFALRSLTFLVSRIAGQDFVLRHMCLNTLLSKETPQKFLQDVHEVLSRADTEPEKAMVDFTRLLVGSKDADPTHCWRDILEEWIRVESKPGMFESSTKLLGHTLQTMKVAEWVNFISDIESLFKDVITQPNGSVPPIFQQTFHRWVIRLSLLGFIPTLTRLEEALGAHSEAVKLFLSRDSGVWEKNLTRILECLKKAEYMQIQGEDGRLESLLHKVTGKLSKKFENDWSIADCVYSMLELTPMGIEACQRIWDAKHDLLEIPGLVNSTATQDPPVSSRLSVFSKSSATRPVSQAINQAKPASEKSSVPIAVTEIMVAGWLQDPDVVPNDRDAIKNLASILNLEIYMHGIPKDKMKEAETFYEMIELEIIAEAERLEGIKRALKEKDPAGTAILLEQLGIPDLNPLDEEIEKLPAGIIDAVEKRGDNEVEISFPLKAYTDLQRSALGLPKEANTLLVRLFVDYVNKMPPSFCIHLDSDPQTDSVTQEHTPWVCLQDSKAPERAYCKSVQTAFTWQMNRILYRYLKDNTLSIAGIHSFIKTRMTGLAHRCIVCDASHSAANAQLRRSTTCNSSSCSRIWNNLPLEVRVPEIRSDTFAIDVILTSVYAAAMSTRTELLPGCPITGTANITAILNALPSLKVLSHAVDLSSVLRSYHKDAERLLLWACTHFRGHLTTASGKFSIPSMPTGTHQFILANANPKLETDFSSSLPRSSPQSMVLFHGTSLDRLPAILAQGLQIKSGTGLQRTGAAHGKGIYMATDPATSFSYSPAQVSWKNSGLNNMRLLLGCEVAGSGRSVSSGIHVITDEKTVIVRYIFMLTYSAYTPNVNHITPAMLSGMVALRSGSA